MKVRGRLGVASVIGMLFMALVFMVGIGAQVYVSGLQAQSEQAAVHAQERLAQHSDELLEYSTPVSGLTTTNSGPSQVQLVGMIVKLGNGTQYLLDSSSTPAFPQASLPSGSSVGVAGLVPSGTCSPGSETCANRFASVVDGQNSGGSVGLITSLGNVFWYVPAASEVQWASITGYPASCPGGESVSQLAAVPVCSSPSAVSSWDTTGHSTSGTNSYSPTGLTAQLAPDTEYAFLASIAVTPELGTEHYNFEVGQLPAGASLVIACAPTSSTSSGSGFPGGCTTSTGTPVASTSFSFGSSPPVYQDPGVFGVVDVGSTGGTLQLEVACTSSCGSVTVVPGSFITLQELG